MRLIKAMISAVLCLMLFGAFMLLIGTMYAYGGLGAAILTTFFVIITAIFYVFGGEL